MAVAVQERTGGMGSNSVLIPSNRLCPGTNKTSPNRFPLKELYASADELAPKARKPYTITKQRERWTEEEHKKFLEALKLYGRAWRRIEEHIGSKTAVQIRSHAQKFFSKVVRESTGNNSDSVKSIEIPPPRPKRKPMHPYPRKLVHPCTKGIVAPEQLERSPSPVESIFEQDNRSPTSVLSAVGSDTTGSTVSNAPSGCGSPLSSAARSNPLDMMLSELENGYPSSSSSAEEENRSPSPGLGVAGTSQQENSPMNLELDYKGNACAKETSSVETPMTSLKLFGRTLLVSDSQRPSSGGNNPQSHKSPLTDPENQQENLDKEMQKPEQISAVDTTQRDFPGGPCKRAWSPWPNRTPPLFYCMPYQQESANSTENPAPVPWWALYGNLPFSMIHSHNMNSRVTPDSPVGASDNIEAQKESSWSDSNSGPVTATATGDKNSDVVDSRISEQSDEKARVAAFRLKIRENPAFSYRTPAPENWGKGFVPYKRCVAERDVQQSQIGCEERDGRRVRLCL